MEPQTIFWTVFLLIVFLLSLYKYVTRNYGYWKKRGVPYLTPKPLVGNLTDVLLFRKNLGHFFENIYKESESPFVGIWTFTVPLFIVKSPELIKHILVKDFQYFQGRTLAYDETADSFGSNMLLMSKHPLWKCIRNALRPMFTPSKLKTLCTLIDSNAREMIDYMDNQQSNYDAKELCTKYTINVSTSTMFGVEANCFLDENSVFREIARLIFDFNYIRGFRSMCYFLCPWIVSWLKLKFFDVEVNNFFRDFCWETIKRREGEAKRNDLINTMIEMKQKKYDQNDIKLEGDKIVAQGAQVFAAGIETTSSTMAFTLYELSLNKTVQDRLRNELKRIIGEEGLTYESIQKMKYLHNVISETLRKYPALPFLERLCIEDYKIPESDVILEKNTRIYIPMFGLHYDPKYFPEPQTYDPERFDLKNSANRHPFVYLPFGEGPRNCIGEQFGLLFVKYGLIRILLSYEVKRNENTPVPLKFKTSSFVLQAESGLPMNFFKL